MPIKKQKRAYHNRAKSKSQMKDSNNHLKKILYAALKKENRKISLTEIQKCSLRAAAPF